MIGPDGTAYVPTVVKDGGLYAPGAYFPLLDAAELALYGGADDLRDEPDEGQPDLPVGPPE